MHRLRDGLQPHPGPPAGGRHLRRLRGTLVTREDDTEEALVVRLRTYHEKTDPVLDLFRRKEYVAVIDATPGRDEVQQAIRDSLALPAYKPGNAAAS